MIKQFTGNNLLRLLTILPCLILFLSGCESETDSTNSPDLPDVAGVYSFNTDIISVNCDDGSSTTNPAIALEFKVLQNLSNIDLENAIPSGGISGVNIVSTTGASGSVRSDSSFDLTQSSTATFTGVTDDIALNYSITGGFTSNGWSGNYTFTADSSLFGFCRFSALFSGEKINTGLRTTHPTQLLENEEVAFDFYDSSGVLISLLGYK